VYAPVIWLRYLCKLIFFLEFCSARGSGYRKTALGKPPVHAISLEERGQTCGMVSLGDNGPQQAFRGPFKGHQESWGKVPQWFKKQDHRTNVRRNVYSENQNCGFYTEG